MQQKMIDVALKQVEQQKERELTSKFSARMKAATKDFGKPGSVRHTILTSVASENYDRAKAEVERYLNSKDEFPAFRSRTEKYAKYCLELIEAVNAKRNFPNLQNLAMARQQELFDRAMAHFEDIKACLKKMEQIEVELRLEDVRSTVLVVKVIIYCCFAIFALGFLLELSKGVVPTASIVIDAAASDFTNWLFDLLGI